MGKCVVFGIAGQDGAYLGELLQSQGHLVCGVSRSTGGDVANRQYVETLIKDIVPDYVFHFAANSTTRHDALFENHETISTGTLNLLESVRIHAPDCRVFITGSGVQFVNQGLPISEKDAFAPLSVYAVARIQSVYAARYYRSLGMKVYVGYLFHHESPLRKPNHLCKKISAFAKQVRQGHQGQLVLGNIAVRKEVAFAGDIVAGIWTLVNQDVVFEAAIGTGIAYSIEEWLEACFSKVGADWHEYVRVESDTFVPEYPVLVSNPETIFSLGWAPRVSFDALAEMMLN
jgi:GDPmannose 4,6-dehydratase